MTRATDQEQQWCALMTSAQGGDAIAYARLLSALSPFVRSLVRRHLGAPDLVEDVLQDVLLTIHRVRHTYDPARPLSAWVAAIATRRRIDLLRRRGRIRAHETEDSAAYETFADPAANKDEQAQSDREEASAVLSELPPRQREALELLKINEMSLVEASAASGQSVAALKVNVHRAIKRLRSRWSNR